ncbi:MAG TPA: ferredoxin--nitrite reductase [Chloroflexota bacterium]|nr:ferredoxin--nitrite reductase [Chloroflexota bacterium]
MNQFERIKQERDGLDVWPEIERYARAGWEAISDDDKTRLKWYGVFFRRHIPGFFMLRIRIPNGIASSDQVRVIGKVASEFGRGEVDITTRQQVQIRWFRIEHVPEILARLSAVGVDTRQTGMDNIRNVAGCPLAGVTTHELFDASPVTREFTSRFLGNRAFSNLPRKFNVAMTACMDNCLHLETQDIGMGPALKRVNGRLLAGFNVMVGGKNGSGGLTPARPLDVFVTRDEACDVAVAIVEIFRDHGSRASRSRARLAFLVDDWGVERFRDALEQRLGRRLEGAGADARTGFHTDHLGVAPQRESGRYSVGLAAPVGRVSAAQIAAVADLADAYGRGEIRFTVGQNLILPHVPDALLPRLLNESLLEQLRPDPTPAMRGTVSCTGLGTCDLALAETKEMALRVARSIDGGQRLGRPITVHWSGCPAACANHHVADIGVQGDKARVNGEVIEVYDVFVGGSSGPETRAGTRVLAQVPANQIGAVIERLAHAHGRGESLVEEGLRIAADVAAPAPAPVESGVA